MEIFFYDVEYTLTVSLKFTLFNIIDYRLIEHLYFVITDKAYDNSDTL